MQLQTLEPSNNVSAILVCIPSRLLESASIPYRLYRKLNIPSSSASAGSATTAPSTIPVATEALRSGFSLDFTSMVIVGCQQYHRCKSTIKGGKRCSSTTGHEVPMGCKMGTDQICTPYIACDGQPDITGHWPRG